MAKLKTKAKAKTQPAPVLPDIDATPERIAQAERVAGLNNGHALHDVVDMSGASSRKLGKHRRFKDSRIDMLYGTWGALTWAQWFAGTWYREQLEVGRGSQRLCADYGQSSGGGSGDPSPLPLSDRAERARKVLREAQQAISLDCRAAVEDAINDPHESLTGRAAMARLSWWRDGLQALAVHLRVTA